MSTTTGAAVKPLLLLDVDGPLNPFRLITRAGHLPVKARPGEDPFTYTRHELRPTGWTNEEHPPLPVLLADEHGTELRALAEVFTLVWATTWVDDANRFLAPLLGLPDLPVIDWPPGANQESRFGRRHTGSWKTRHILAWLDEHAVGPDGRVLPWVWVDDEVNAANRAAVRAHYGYAKGETPPVRSWLLRIEPSHGLRRGDFTDLRTWAEANT